MKELVASIIEDGIVDASEVQQLRDVIFADGKVDKEEVQAVFEINDAVSGNANDPSWGEFMAEVVCAYALEDEATPGVVDSDEGDFIASLIEGDGQVDTVEVAVLTALRNDATSIESTRLTSLIQTTL